jgi:hypothetical protein
MMGRAVDACTFPAAGVILFHRLATLDDKPS